MNTPSTRSTWLAIAALLVLGAALGWAILGRDKPGAGHEAHGHSHGAHGHEGHGHETHGHGQSHANEDGHDEGQARAAKGPHGGRLFSQGPHAIEIVIAEDGEAPRLRLYVYQDGQPVPAARLTPSSFQLTLERLGRPAETPRFKPQGDFLVSEAVIGEPHSFKLSLSAPLGGQVRQFGYEQVEERVTMTDAQLKEADVALATAGPARIGQTLSLLGEVKVNADRTVIIVPRLAGLVERVLVNAGESVRQGQVLAVLSSAALADLRAQALAARQRLALARSTHDREKQLWQDKISAEQDYQQARTALQEADIADQNIRQKLANLGVPALSSANALTRFELRAPVAGVVTDKRIAVGQALSETEPVFTVSDLSSVWVEAPVAARDLGQLATGQAARVQAIDIALAGAGRITHISALVGGQTRTATARVVLPNPRGQWRPGLPARVVVTAGETEVPVAVQAEALQSLRDWQVVFGRYGEHLEARPLTLGRRDGQWVEVLEGLNAGERYATRNSYLIKAELGKAGAAHEH